MRRVSFYKPAALALAALSALVQPALMGGPFTPGNLVVVTVGDATVPADTSNGAAAVSLLEFAPSGTGQSPVQSIALSDGAGAKLTLTANAPTTEGVLSRTSDGRFLLLAGYDAAVGTTGLVAGSSTRVIGRVDQSGGVAFSATDLGAGSSVRSAASVDGSQVYMALGGSTPGIRSFTFGAAAGTGVVSNAAKVAQVFDGQVYESLQTAIYKTDTPLPTGPSGVTALPGVTPTNAGGFVLLDRDASVAGVDTLYVADQNLGLRKFSFDGTTWTARGGSPGGGPFGTGLTGITARVNGANAEIYVTIGNNAIGISELLTLTDATAFNADIGSSLTYTTLARAAPNTEFRGVAFAPVPEPGSLILGTAVAAGALAAGMHRHLRRRVTPLKG